MGVQGVRLNPLGLFLRTSMRRRWRRISRPASSPLAEGLLFSYSTEGCMDDCMRGTGVLPSGAGGGGTIVWNVPSAFLPS
jgi:hypothetical protein